VIIGDRALLARDGVAGSRCHLRTRVIQPGADLPADLPVGRVDARGELMAYRYVVEAARSSPAAVPLRAMATAPLSKEAMQLAGHRLSGHTDLLAELAGNVPVRIDVLADGSIAHRAGQRPRAASAGHRPGDDRGAVLQTLQLADEALRRRRDRATPAGRGRPQSACERVQGLFGDEEQRPARAAGDRAGAPTGHRREWSLAAGHQVYMRARRFRAAERGHRDVSRPGTHPPPPP
jgi:hypothetical protein